MMKFLFAVAVIATVVAIGSAQSCTESYTFNSKIGVCFKYYKQGVVFADAESQCKADGAILPSIHSAAAEEHITGRLGRMGIGLWLGARRTADGGWAWADGSPFDYDDWVTGYPSNDADDACALIGGTDGSVVRGWRNWSCDGLHLGFICIDLKTAVSVDVW